MKFLFDQNVAPRLVDVLQPLFPGSIHVRDAGLPRANDRDIWDYALENAFIIVSKDADFRQLSFVLGYPPKFIWIRCGNCSTDEIEDRLRRYYDAIVSFSEQPESSLLAIG